MPQEDCLTKMSFQCMAWQTDTRNYCLINDKTDQCKEYQNWSVKFQTLKRNKLTELDCNRDDNFYTEKCKVWGKESQKFCKIRENTHSQRCQMWRRWRFDSFMRKKDSCEPNQDCNTSPMFRVDKKYYHKKDDRIETIKVAVIFALLCLCLCMGMGCVLFFQVSK